MRAAEKQNSRIARRSATEASRGPRSLKTNTRAILASHGPTGTNNKRTEGI
jgi:hypothetical protein